ncbi:putative DNA modification/repair radical SAM protein [Phenylobacterium sp.]|jgi:putative DNA modification/repair radical SAM protein|uniref:putative DNA modification/repair radical SAM protein n=1 Tax=Phenylobacterium sp. TaxID=1871053 RepID=UPI002E3116A6|nr:putative DNA modification/repair radical SAM protein [Phenylobacterium sp.]HEX4710998.1 putative DNA modification/repair radical SAM protein [Phenylobacterium sp.]
MAVLDLKRKLAILSDAAKYDASCASSGGAKRDSRGGKGVGSIDGGMGICHAYAPDGRCISLLKILLTNFCVYDCAYCVNRVSSNTPRARFSVAEVCDLTLGFYKRNYIEGLFLSSGIIRTADYTMEEIVRVARTLREVHDFRGYLHLKIIPEASPALVNQAALYADRVSINIELPRDESLAKLAPEKNVRGIKKAMGAVRLGVEAGQETGGKASPPRFAPAGQSTQMIVGADAASDGEILKRSEMLYGAYRLRRVYYSAFSPIPDSTARLPLSRPPLVREHRLYQADWLMRFYGFDRAEIVGETDDLALDIDPKLAWALRHRGEFPLDLNAADRERMLRVPGLGVRSVDKMLEIRRFKALTLEDVRRLSRGIEKLKPFIVTADWSPGELTDKADLQARVAQPPQQMALF